MASRKEIKQAAVAAAEAKKATNEARRGMTRKERRADKRVARITSKVRNRP